MRLQGPTKQTRTRRACDQCAQSKSKCDFREPCGRCNARSLTCSQARKRHGRVYPMSLSQPREASMVPDKATASPQTGDIAAGRSELFGVSPPDTIITADGSITEGEGQEQLHLQQLETMSTIPNEANAPQNFSLPNHPHNLSDIWVDFNSEGFDFPFLSNTYSDLGSMPMMPFFHDYANSDECLPTSLPTSIVSDGTSNSKVLCTFSKAKKHVRHLHQLASH